MEMNSSNAIPNGKFPWLDGGRPRTRLSLPQPSVAYGSMDPLESMKRLYMKLADPNVKQNIKRTELLLSVNWKTSTGDTGQRSDTDMSVGASAARQSGIGEKIRRPSIPYTSTADVPTPQREQELGKLIVPLIMLLGASDLFIVILAHLKTELGSRCTCLRHYQIGPRAKALLKILPLLVNLILSNAAMTIRARAAEA
ncbi:hypothetical protein BT96DRAFT_1026889 [Gymnopus androsaceus JB14]|uniref:Uncharacterized protein n=1 Tax=Gymnopus androsaceus JB14 TaxID=1447944 RepID=A0A6A4GFU2_9AGAR|nr:hypothetical protein BT96DRAFT_1026889 [Gymnopus androsaceus JB14]